MYLPVLPWAERVFQHSLDRRLILRRVDRSGKQPGDLAFMLILKKLCRRRNVLLHAFERFDRRASGPTQEERLEEGRISY